MKTKKETAIISKMNAVVEIYRHFAEKKIQEIFNKSYDDLNEEEKEELIDIINKWIDSLYKVSKVRITFKNEIEYGKLVERVANLLNEKIKKIYSGLNLINRLKEIFIIPDADFEIKFDEKITKDVDLEVEVLLNEEKEYIGDDNYYHLLMYILALFCKKKEYYFRQVLLSQQSHLDVVDVFQNINIYFVIPEKRKELFKKFRKRVFKRLIKPKKEKKEKFEEEKEEKVEVKDLEKIKKLEEYYKKFIPVSIEESKEVEIEETKPKVEKDKFKKYQDKNFVKFLESLILDEVNKPTQEIFSFATLTDQPFEKGESPKEIRIFTEENLIDLFEFIKQGATTFDSWVDLHEMNLKQWLIIMKTIFKFLEEVKKIAKEIKPKNNDEEIFKWLFSAGGNDVLVWGYLLIRCAISKETLENIRYIYHEYMPVYEEFIEKQKKVLLKHFEKIFDVIKGQYYLIDVEINDLLIPYRKEIYNNSYKFLIKVQKEYGTEETDITKLDNDINFLISILIKATNLVSRIKNNLMRGEVL
ncbi:MAG: hypothetical protein QXO40_00290 [Candidatus Aenigmatarchaeota archaeon]